MVGTDRMNRRRFLTRTASAVAVLDLVAGSSHEALSQTSLAQTPSCHDDDEPTLRQPEGPYFKPSSPERANLFETGMPGKVLDLTGFVLTRNCKPIARVLLDIWQANDRGEYDNRGFKLRGHMYSDENGHFRFRTVVPGPYEDRTRHIHFKIQAPGQSVLTTQLYFPDEPRNRSDVFFRQDLVIPVVPAEGGISGLFNFVIDMSS